MTERAPIIEHIEVDNPDDPMGMPAYGGPLERAGEFLIPGTYTGYAHYTNGEEGHETFTVRDDGTVVR